ncbi:hypothetical protein ACYX34_11385 [Nitrospira sp. CMX1]|nr:hypothetical protein [Nitrospira sp.]
MNHEDKVLALKGGDRRSGWRSNQVIVLVRRTPTGFPALIDWMDYEDELLIR